MNLYDLFYPRHSVRFKGGNGAPAAPLPPTPTAPPPIQAPAAPPATTNAIEVTQARADAKRQAAGRKGINSTILGGADQNNNQTQALGGSGNGKNTLLGGG